MSAWGMAASSSPLKKVTSAAAAAVASVPAASNNDTRSSTKPSPKLKATMAPPPNFDPEALDLYENVTPVDCIELEGVALLQIMKHCHENLPHCVAGSLLGMENGKCLEVTNSFPSPNSMGNLSATPEPNAPNNAYHHGTSKKRESDAYQMDMMKNLREVNIDNNKVGWYQSILHGTFCTSSIIEYQFQYQQSLGPNAICLLYDSTETLKGNLSLKAFRLKKAFVDTYKKKTFTKEAFAKEDIRSTTLLEEIPIKLHNSDLIKCWIHEFAAAHDALQSANAFERLDLATNSYLENCLKNISVWADELAQEHYKFQGYERALAKQRAAYQQWQQRQRDENKLLREHGEPLVPEEDPDFFKSVHQPSRLETLLITKQMNSYCEQINRFAGKSFQKLFLTAKFHQSNAIPQE